MMRGSGDAPLSGRSNSRWQFSLECDCSVPLEGELAVSLNQ